MEPQSQDNDKHDSVMGRGEDNAPMKRSADKGVSPAKKKPKVQPLPPGATKLENKGEGGNCLRLHV